MKRSTVGTIILVIIALALLAIALSGNMGRFIKSIVDWLQKGKGQNSGMDSGNVKKTNGKKQAESGSKVASDVTVKAPSKVPKDIPQTSAQMTDWSSVMPWYNSAAPVAAGADTSSTTAKIGAYLRTILPRLVLH